MTYCKGLTCGSKGEQIIGNYITYMKTHLYFHNFFGTAVCRMNVGLISTQVVSVLFKTEKCRVKFRMSTAQFGMQGLRCCIHFQ